MKLLCPDKRKYPLFILFFILALLSLNHSGQGQTITEVQPLSFGKIVLSDFNVAADLTVAPDGSVIKDPTIYLMIAPQPGIYDISGEPINSVYTVTFDPSINLSHAGINFLVDTFTTNGPLMTDGSGNHTFRIGATLHSQGGGVTYSDGNYQGSLNITVNF